MKRMRKTQRIGRGMTLGEVLVTMAIIGFTVPLILAATTSTLRSRQAAECDTRSNWILRDVQQRIMMKWASMDSASGIDHTFPFPTPELPQHRLQMHYDADGRWMREPTSAYLVEIDAQPHGNSGPVKLARIEITVQHPAKALPDKRNKRVYQYITTRRGMK